MGLEKGAVSCDFKLLKGSTCGFTALPSSTTQQLFSDNKVNTDILSLNYSKIVLE